MFQIVYIPVHSTRKHNRFAHPYQIQGVIEHAGKILRKTFMVMSIIASFAKKSQKENLAKKNVVHNHE